MANYSVTVWAGTVCASLSAAATMIEAQLETVDNAKTIRYIDIKETGPGKYWRPVLVYDT